MLIMDLLFKPPFKKFVKKQNRAFQLVIEDETEKIKDNPERGETKKGNLAGFFIHKFVFQRQEYLIAYQIHQDCITFYMIGTHENFYRELKRYIKEVEG
jgi:hypothetical protein